MWAGGLILGGERGKKKISDNSFHFSFSIRESEFFLLRDFQVKIKYIALKMSYLFHEYEVMDKVWVIYENNCGKKKQERNYLNYKLYIAAN